MSFEPKMERLNYMLYIAKKIDDMEDICHTYEFDQLEINQIDAIRLINHERYKTNNSQ